jgi:hypothetical protein
MASAFWTLEDGRGFSRKWTWMASMLKIIAEELKEINAAEEFYNYLCEFVYCEENGDECNGYGGFIRENQNTMLNFDLRTFAPTNRIYFWEASQKALAKLMVTKNEIDEGTIHLLTVLLDMHKRIQKGENPVLLNHLTIIKAEPSIKFGPGW